MLRIWLFFLYFVGLSAHPFASYLDGPFVSFGMDMGGGSIAHEYFYDPPINAVKQQAYQTKLKAYQEAIAKIKANQTQTINTLKTIAGQLANLTPTSTQATTLLAKLNALNTDNQTPAAIQKSVEQYLAYLQKIVAEYGDNNQERINEAQNALNQYSASINKYKDASNGQPNSQDLQILQNAINTLESYNTQISDVANKINQSRASKGLAPITFTPLPLPTPLNANGSNIGSLSQAQIKMALNGLSNELGAVISSVGTNIESLQAGNQEIAVENAAKLSQLQAEKNAATNQALKQIIGISQMVGRALHNVWVNYADGQVFGVNNADVNGHATVNGRQLNINISDGKYTYNGKQYDYINNAYNCVFVPILRSNGQYGGYVSNNCSANQIAVPKQLQDLGLSAYNIWNTLFDVSYLQKEIPALLNSNCAGGVNQLWGCASNGKPQITTEQAQQDMNTFFNVLNNYLGNGERKAQVTGIDGKQTEQTISAYSFDGNFENSKIYTLLQADLNNTNTTEGIAAALSLMQGYQQGVKNMLSAFQQDPVWIMSTLQNTETQNSGNAAPNVKYCWQAAGGNAGLSFPFNNGVYNRMCGANTSWSNAIFVGFFGFTPSSQKSAENQIDSSTEAYETAITELQQANKNLADFNPTQTFPIPSFTPLPPVPLKNPSPLPPLPLRPIISTSPAPMPTISVPNKPVLTFASGNLRANSLQLGMQAEGGYQKYFTPFFGVSTYGYLAYRYLYMGHAMSEQTNLSGLNRYSLGFGANLLTNFYSKIRKSKIGRVKIQTYGFFAGLLALGNMWNAYILQAPMQARYNLNVDGVFGLSVRVNRFKWSLGVHVPLVGQTQRIKSVSKEGLREELQLIDNYKSSQLFLNFTQIF